MADPHSLLNAADLSALARTQPRVMPAAGKVPIAVFANLLRLADGAVIYLSAFVLYLGYLEPSPEPGWAAYQLAMVVATVAAMNLFAVAEVYDPRVLTTGRMGVLRLVGSWAAIWLGILVTAVMFKTAQDYSRVWFAGWGFAVGVWLLASRLAAWLLIQQWIASGRLTINVAVIGGGDLVATLAPMIANAEGRLYQVVGLFDDAAADDAAGIPGLADLEALIRAGRVQMAVIAVPWTEEARILGLMARLRGYPVDIRVAPTTLVFPFSRARYTTISGVPLLDVFSAPLSGWRSVVKRAEDLVLGAALLLLFLPLMLIIAAAVKCDSPGPVLFRQKRYGYNNQLIEVFKFRSMHHAQTDHNAERLVRPNDARVTRLGAWLRRTSLDELPQLLNVVRGDMSLVGPRPHALRAKAADRLYEDVVEEYASRHRVKPGITGWAQVNGWRGVTDTEDQIRQRVEHDLHYVENWSLAFDLLILAMTVIAVARPTNAH